MQFFENIFGKEIPNISDDTEKGQYYTAVFIDVRQAFDKVWHFHTQKTTYTNDLAERFQQNSS